MQQTQISQHGQTSKVTAEQIRKVQAKIDAIAETLLGKEYVGKINFKFRTNMKAVGGYAVYSTKSLELNEQLFLQYEDDYINNTVAHEVCHVVQFIKYPKAKQAHGVEWKMLMRMIGLEPKRCHNYDTTFFLQDRFKYTCRCEGKIFNVGKIIHKKIQAGEYRRCPTCKTSVLYSGNNS